MTAAFGGRATAELKRPLTEDAAQTRSVKGGEPGLQERPGSDHTPEPSTLRNQVFSRSRAANVPGPRPFRREVRRTGEAPVLSVSTSSARSRTSGARPGIGMTLIGVSSARATALTRQSRSTGVRRESIGCALGRSASLYPGAGAFQAAGQSARLVVEGSARTRIVTGYQLTFIDVAEDVGSARPAGLLGAGVAGCRCAAVSPFPAPVPVVPLRGVLLLGLPGNAAFIIGASNRGEKKRQRKY